MPRIAHLALLGAVGFSGLQAADGAETQSVSSTSVIPLDMNVDVGCADDGNGEVVALSGELHVVSEATEQSPSRWVVVSRYTPRGVTGTGLTSGDDYRGAGGTGSVTVVTESGVRSSQHNHFRLIGLGSAADLIAHTTAHVVVDDTGVVVVEASNVFLTCRAGG